MEPILIPVALVALLVAAVLVWRFKGRSAPTDPPEGIDASELAAADVPPKYPAEGLLISQDVLRAAGSSPATVWEVLEEASEPVAIEYRPMSEAEAARLRTVPVNTSVQRAMVEVLTALKPKGPTLYKVVLPKGAELVKAVGTDGFRGFARNGTGITAHAILKPVAAGGAMTAGWPIFAVAGTVMVIDMAAQREMRAHQRKVEAILERQEERHYIERIKDQRSADAQLSRAISLILDGHNPSLELALKSAYDEFHRTCQFLEKYRGVIEELVEADGKIYARRLEEVLGGKSRDVNYFMRELHLSRGAIAIRRKALLADAAGIALADPQNPYRALRKFLDSQAHQLEEADHLATTLTEQLTTIKLKGRWPDSPRSIAAKERRISELASTPSIDEDVDVRLLSTATGEIVQVVAVEEDDDAEGPL